MDESGRSEKNDRIRKKVLDKSDRTGYIENENNNHYYLGRDMDTVRNHSKKRDAIYQTLAATDTHPSAEWIYLQLKDRIPDLSLGTVYRNLKLFQQEGRIISVATVKGTERFDANTHPHTHLLCRCCGAVVDLHLVKLPEEVREQVREETGSLPEGWDLNFYGCCRECRQKQSVSKKQNE